MLLFRPPVLPFGLRGVKPADFAAGGDYPSPLANDADLPGDADSEWLWALLTPLPSSGTTQVDDRGGYALVGAADGAHTQAYRGLVMPPSGAVVVYESSITSTVGAAGPGVAVEVDTALALSAVQIGSVGLAVETDVAYALSAAATGGTADPAAVWSYVMSNGQTAEANVLAILAALTASPSAASIAAAVWDSVLAAHQTAGTTGAALTTPAQIADAVWAKALP